MSRSNAMSGMLATVVLMLPWLNPIASGPTPSVIPWLVSAACVACMCLLVAYGDVRWDTTIRNSWLLAALVSSGLGLLQYFDASAVMNAWINTPSPGVAYGNLRQRNQFATLVNMGLITLVCLALRRHTLRAAGDGRRDAIWLGAAAALLAFGNAASLSRTGALQLVGIVVLAMVWPGWRTAPARRVLLMAVLVYVVASVALPWLAGRDPFASGIVDRFSEPLRSCQSRLVLWSNILHLIGINPWTGWGWGELDFAHFTTLYPGPRFCDILDNAHNLPLHLAVELGVPVAVFACGAVAWLLWRARPQQETCIERQMAWAVLAVLGFHSLLEYPLWYGPFQITLGLCCWILWRVPAHVPEPGTAISCRALHDDPMQGLCSRWARLCLTGAGIAMGAMVALALWDYQRVSQIYRPPQQRSPAYRVDTMAKVQNSWLFRRQVLFAELTLTQADAGNAARLNLLARQLLHFSPEPRVIEKAIDTARLLRHDDEAESLARRFQAAFADDYGRWEKR